MMPHRGARSLRGARTTLAGATALVVLAAVLVSCMPLYVPPVPEAPSVAVGARLSEASELTAAGGRPRLTLTLVPGDALVSSGAWLAVQWYGPANTQAASDSVWVEGREPSVHAFELPPDVEVVQGEWRAVVSLDGVLLRQFRVDVTADPEA